MKKLTPQLCEFNWLGDGFNSVVFFKDIIKMLVTDRYYCLFSGLLCI